jgi:hypothetical protein
VPLFSLSIGTGKVLARNLAYRSISHRVAAS